MLRQVDLGEHAQCRPTFSRSTSARVAADHAGRFHVLDALPARRRATGRPRRRAAAPSGANRAAARRGSRTSSSVQNGTCRFTCRFRERSFSESTHAWRAKRSIFLGATKRRFRRFDCLRRGRHAAPLAPPRLPPGRQPLGRRGAVFLTGTQALIRLLLMQRAARRRRAASTRRASSAATAARRSAWSTRRRGRRASCSTSAGVRFLPAINEELGATAVLGTQRVESDPERTAEGVFAMWYGKGPGVDRAGDALKHGNAYGSSPHGGVLVVAGDDHGCVSSSMPHQSDQAFQAWQHADASRRPTWPSTSSSASTAGRCRASRATGSASRRCRKWSRAASTVDLDLIERARRRVAGRATRCARATGYRAAGRRPALPLARPAVAEDRAAPARQARRGARVRARQQRSTATSSTAPRATVGIVTCGKAHFDLHGGVAPPGHLARRARRRRRAHLQGGPRAIPIEPTRMRRVRARACDEILVDRGEGPASSRRSCATCSTTRAVRPRDRRQARRAAAGRWCRRSASCGRRG